MGIFMVDRRLEFLRPHAHKIAAILGLEDMYLIIRYSNENYVQESQPHIINIAPDANAAAGLSLVDVLAHEMRHVQQFKLNRISTLDADDTTQWVWWDGSLVEVPDDDLTTPWEQDANQFETIYSALAAQEDEICVGF